MCSVDGFTGKHPFTIEQFAAFNQDRGPDGTRYWCDDNVSIAHSLLAIQDNPDAIQQPVERAGKVLSYNGEIYGLDGFDTDHLMNILCAGDWARLKYETNGMWGFSLYDQEEQTITLCRDHCGVKNIYYVIINRQLFWSSTIKPLIAVSKHFHGRLSLEEGVQERLDLLDGFWQSPSTWFYGIRSLIPGEIVKFDINQGRIVASDSLWGVEWNLYPNYEWSPEEYQEIAVKAFKDTCTAPGVKKCLSLSGGLDSTLLASINKDQDNFFCSSVRYDEGYRDYHHRKDALIKEADIAVQTCKELGIQHHAALLGGDYHKRYFDETIERMGNFSWLASRVIPRFKNISNASVNNAKIYITGDLADEILTGYNGHVWYARPKGHRGYYTSKRFHTWDQIRKIRDDDGVGSMDKLYPWHINSVDDNSNHLFWRMLNSTDSFCGIIDLLCGSFGIESRVPYLHQEFVKYAATIPFGVRMQKPRYADSGSYKYMTREVMKDWLPDHVQTNPRKTGFSVPWDARHHKTNNMNRQKEFRKAYQILQERFTFA